MIRVTVLVQGRLARRASTDPEGQIIEMPEGSRVRDLLSITGLIEEEVRHIAVNGRQKRLDSALRPRDFVEFG